MHDPLNDEPAEEQQLDDDVMPIRRYPALKNVEALLRTFGYINILAAIVTFVLWANGGESPLAGIISVPFIFTSLVAALILLGFAELIQVFIDIEGNTRRMSYAPYPGNEEPEIEQQEPAHIAVGGAQS